MFSCILVVRVNDAAAHYVERMWEIVFLDPPHHLIMDVLPCGLYDDHGRITMWFV